MNIDKLLEDLNNLIGLPLRPINVNSETISLLDIDRETGRYYIKPTSGKKTSRKLEEFEFIWKDLCEFGYANVELSLGGSGSSRHHPETLLSNLPYIEFFKYKNKKHILIKEEATHTYGTIKEVSQTEIRKIRLALSTKENFSLFKLHGLLKTINSTLNISFKEVQTKYPGEIKQEGFFQSLDLLSSLEKDISQIFYRDVATAENTFINTNAASLLTSTTPYNLNNNNSQDEDNISDETEEPSDEADDPSDNEQTNFDRKNLKIRQVAMSFSLIYDRIQYKEIELQPDFQRKERVWSQKEKSLLIESILLGLPIPMFYFAEREDSSWVIVDGLQRTTTIYDYMRGEFSLTDLKYFKRPEDGVYKKYFQDLPRQYQRKIREYQINGHLISVEKNDFEMVRELFQRINTYGSTLSPQEIRCALNPGSSVPFIRYMAETPLFINATFGKVNDKRMRDMEYTLGVISHILFGYSGYSFKKEDDFLVSTMQYLNKYNFELIGRFVNDGGPKSLPLWKNNKCDSIFFKIKDAFENGLFLAEKIFGDQRFKKPGSADTINKQLIIMTTSVLSLLDDDITSYLVEHKNSFVKQFNLLINGDIKPYVPWISDIYNEQERSYEYSISQSTGKRATILFRFDNFIELIKHFTSKDIIVKGFVEYDNN